MSVCCSGCGTGWVSGCDAQAHQTSGRDGMAMTQRSDRQFRRRMLRIELRFMEVLLVKQPTCGWNSKVPYSKIQAEGINRNHLVSLGIFSSSGQPGWPMWQPSCQVRNGPKLSCSVCYLACILAAMVRARKRGGETRNRAARPGPEARPAARWATWAKWDQH